MRKDKAKFSIDVTASQPENCKFMLTEVGIDFHDDLTFEEWSDLGQRLACAGRSLGFMIGDWINYGESHKEYGDKYIEALQATGYDYNTLRHFARVSRLVKLCVRTHNLSWEHHRKVASLKDEKEQRKWLEVASKAVEEGKPMSTRRLQKSILLGREATDKDMQIDPADKGRDNPHPHINGLLAWWRKMEKVKWLECAMPEQKHDLKVDLQPVVDIYNQL